MVEVTYETPVTKDKTKDINFLKHKKEELKTEDDYYRRTIKNTTLIKSNIMVNLSLKYNKNFMDYNIFKNIEKFLCNNSKKSYYVQFK